jgi:predicted Zn-dependent protease
MTLLRRLVLASTLVAAPAALAGVPGGLDQIGAQFDQLKGLTGKISPAEERALGREAAATLLGAEPVLPDAAVQRYVNRVGLWVALQSERPNLQWRFAVLDDADVNAFAAPGGFVFVTKGLLLTLGSEAELAGALGHEVAHVVRKHHLKALTKDKRIEAVSGAALSSLSNDDPRRQEQVAKLVQGVKTLYARGLDKQDELIADRVGLVYAARAGYDPSGMVGVLQKLDAQDPGTTRMALLLKTHPAPAERLAALDGVFGTGKLDPLRGVEGVERYREALASLVGAR